MTKTSDRLIEGLYRYLTGIPEEDYYYDPDDGDGSDWGACDVCHREYLIYDNKHCGQEGRCWDHCTDPLAHNPEYNFIVQRAIAEVTDGT